jgi:hypothetical protein
MERERERERERETYQEHHTGLQGIAGDGAF